MTMVYFLVRLMIDSYYSTLEVLVKQMLDSYYNE